MIVVASMAIVGFLVSVGVGLGVERPWGGRTWATLLMEVAWPVFAVVAAVVFVHAIRLAVTSRPAAVLYADRLEVLSGLMQWKPILMRRSEATSLTIEPGPGEGVFYLRSDSGVVRLGDIGIDHWQQLIDSLSQAWPELRVVDRRATG